MKLSGLVFILGCCVGYSHTLKILGIFPTMGRSHFFMGEGMMKALHSAGHEVTMISAFPQKKPLANWTDVNLSGIVELMEGNFQAIYLFDIFCYLLIIEL